MLRWVLAIGLAVTLDDVIARWLESTGVAGAIRREEHHPVKWLKLAGEYGYAGVMAGIATVFCTRDRLRAAALVLLSVVSTLGVGVLKWIVGRGRPYRGVAGDPLGLSEPYTFHPFFDGWAGLAAGPNLSFPSANTTLAFATAAAMAMLFPRLRWGFYVIAALTGVERVLENAHYLSDVVVAAALGVGAAHLLYQLLFVRLTDRGDPAAATQQAMLTATHP